MFSPLDPQEVEEVLQRGRYTAFGQMRMSNNDFFLGLASPFFAEIRIFSGNRHGKKRSVFEKNDGLKELTRDQPLALNPGMPVCLALRMSKTTQIGHPPQFWRIAI